MAECHSKKKLDLTGQRFGMLTVLAPADKIGPRTAWLCRCDCGKETVVMTGHLGHPPYGVISPSAAINTALFRQGVAAAPARFIL